MSTSADRLSPAMRAARARRRDAVLSSYRDALSSTPPPSHVTAVILFGSWARGDFDGRSDVDLLVLTDAPGTPAVLEALPDDPPADVVVLDRGSYERRLKAGDPFPTAIADSGIRLWPAD